MNVNFYVTCIADIVKAGVAKNSVLLLEKLGCNVVFFRETRLLRTTGNEQRLCETSDSGYEKPYRNF
ncbi:dehydrogenase [Actinobacillus pleuropneumoniae]|nr:dehydrogenase [Actinobacillus pleuropneumoniae]